ncbi:HvfC/BufC N-terminal domain-containing protein [Vibrio sp. 10N]|uniref:HvfC/BufC N-terminal domain-containing protein n=1 Tax=Vibrio sp. 10N TaxID=3058938 RepID=UPI00281376E2|nr:DNA-binding domain-containing protein [Vibrio sp. 10N]
MMMNLNELQAAFSRSLRHQDNSVESVIIADHFSAHERLQIYRNNFTISLSEALEACYPITLQLVGEECFQSMAKYHVMRCPPTTANVIHYGEGFAQSVAKLENIINAVPYLVDVMALEWAIDMLQQRPPSTAPTTIEPLVNMNAVPETRHSELVFHVKPNHFVLSSQFSIGSLVNAIHSNDLDNFNINQPECVLVIKQGLAKPTLHIIDHDISLLLEGLSCQQPLKVIDPALLSALPRLFALDLVAGFTLDNENTERSML